MCCAPPRLRSTPPPQSAASASSATTSRLSSRKRKSPNQIPHFWSISFSRHFIYMMAEPRKAVDDMVIQALGESTFMKPFAAILVRSMEKNLKVTGPLVCFKLFRWSCYLLKWSQFAAFSKGGFSRLANAQAVLCQVVTDDSFRQRTCKQLLIRLFSEDIY